MLSICNVSRQMVSCRMSVFAEGEYVSCEKAIFSLFCENLKSPSASSKA